MNPILIQTIATLIISIANYLIGFSIGWSSTALQVLDSDGTPLSSKITSSQGGYIGSVPMLGSAIATLISGVLADYVGRKKTTLLSGLIFVLSWVTISTSKTVLQLLIGRFCVGLGNGLIAAVSLTYVNEISQVSVRGALACVLVTFLSIGVLGSYMAGWLLSYEAGNYLGLCTSVLLVLLVIVGLKETPAFLLANGRDKEALKSLKYYRGTKITSSDILEELEYIRSQSRPGGTSGSNADKSEKEILEQEEKAVNVSPFRILLTTKHVYRPLIMCVCSVFLCVSMGIIAIQSYAGQMFQTAAPGLSPHVCSIVLACANVAGGLLSVSLTDRFGRRMLAISTAALATACLLLLGCTLRWHGPAWAAPALVTAFCLANQAGVGVIPYVQLSESFSSNVKSLVTTIALSAMWLMTFLVLATFAPIVEYVGLHGAFFIFGTVSAMVTVFYVLFMKETKGVPLEQIQAMYDQGYLYRKNVFTAVSA